MTMPTRKKGLASAIWRELPGPLKNTILWWAYLPKDTWEGVTGQRDPLTPPRALSRLYMGIGDFRESGQRTLNNILRYCDLKPDGKVLDVGCGAGRLAVALTGYLNSSGGFEGFDISNYPIRWCQQHITTRFPNFHFQVADLYSNRYNPNGRYKASEYRFPYPDNTFDFVHLGSVFTHMLPADVENYLSEIARVTKPGGSSYITYFLLNENSKAAIDAGRTRHVFNHRYEEYWATNPNTPEDVTALQEPMIRDLYRRFGMTIQEPIHYGGWLGIQDALWGQDVVIARKD
jgi:ubiquinone/menaquinone biosynthesis C-methylase UbiE